MQSQAILGPLPEGLRLVLAAAPNCQYQHWFISSGGERLDKDPRIEGLLRKIGEKGTGEVADVEYLGNMPGDEKKRLLEEHCGVRFDTVTIA